MMTATALRRARFKQATAQIGAANTPVTTSTLSRVAAWPPSGVRAQVASVKDVEEVEAAFAPMLPMPAFAAVLTTLAILTFLSVLAVSVAWPRALRIGGHGQAKTCVLLRIERGQLLEICLRA